MKIPSVRETELLALVVAERSGRDVAKRYREWTGQNLSYGTLYVVLRRLVEQGWVKVRDDEDADGRVRFFRVTATGARALEKAREHYDRVANFGLGMDGSVANCELGMA